MFDSEENHLPDISTTLLLKTVHSKQAQKTAREPEDTREEGERHHSLPRSTTVAASVVSSAALAVVVPAVQDAESSEPGAAEDEVAGIADDAGCGGDDPDERGDHGNARDDQCVDDAAEGVPAVAQAALDKVGGQAEYDSRTDELVGAQEDGCGA